MKARDGPARAVAMEYLDFDVSIQQTGWNCHVHVVESPAGEAHADFSSKAVTRNLAVVEDARDIGGELFRSVFRDEVLICWVASLAKAEAEDKGLRLRLRLEGPDLVERPWEVLYDPSRRLFLALDLATPIVRYLEVRQGVVPLAVSPPLRILALIAHPWESPPLASDEEERDLRKAFSTLARCGQVELDVLRRPTLPVLYERLQGIHVLHFIGHGTFQVGEKRGILVLEDDEGRPRLVDGPDLVTLLSGRDPLRLVVLNACESDGHADADVFSGVAQSLVQGGVPAVVAMRSEIEDEVAILFARHFYRVLAKGAPVEAAVTVGRLAILHAGHEIAWATPVLYLRSPDGVIVERKPWWVLLINFLWRHWLSVALGLAGLVVAVHLVTAYRDPCPSPPGLDMKFSKIPGGRFQMGANIKGDGPIHGVILTQPFCMGVYEVTQKQWKEVMGSNPSSTKADDHPVEGVSWDDAEEFVNQLNERDPMGKYWLPTEAQWEYAASDGGKSHYGFGDEVKELAKYGNCKGGGTVAVGSYKATAWGIHDLHGNVAEWVEDVSPYDQGPVTDPRGASQPDDQRMLRGGSFRTNADHCRAAHRDFANPRYPANDTGFRVVRDPVR